MAAPKVYDQYSRPDCPGIVNDMPSRTKQEFAQESDLNFIMARYTETGELPESIVGLYEDFSDAPDFFEAQNILARADAQFSSLPAAVRARCDNDPGKFLEFVHDPANFDELQELGLLRHEVAPRVAVPVGAAPGPTPAPEPSPPPQKP